MLVGSVGAIVGARRARLSAHGPAGARRDLPPKCKVWRPSAKQQEPCQAQSQQRRLTRLFKHYDEHSSGKLEEDQLRRLLVDFSDEAGAGVAAPSGDEMSFVLRVGDRNQDGCIDRTELEQALATWLEYLRQRDEMAEAFARFDSSSTGWLERPELRKYLECIGGDHDVTDGDVDHVMREADVFGDGAIRPVELGLATASWKRRAAKKTGTCFSVRSFLGMLARTRLGGQ